MLRAHIDEPIRGARVKAPSVVVRGWMWLDADHARLEAVEVWSQERMLGETRSLQPRPDVTAALGLPTETRPGFSIEAEMPRRNESHPFSLSVRARFRNGERSPLLAEVEVVPHVRPTEPFAALVDSIRHDDLGLILGDPRRSLSGLLPYCAAMPGAATGGISPHLLGRPSALPLPDAVLDYLAAFHVLEQSTDPVATMLEWHRVLADDGWLYLAVETSQRSTPSPEEYRQQFLRGAAQSREAPPAGPEPDIAAPTSIGFTPSSLLELLRANRFVDGPSARFELLEQVIPPPPGAGGIGLLMRKYRSGRRPAFPETFTLAHAQRKIAPLPLVCPASLAPLEFVNRPDGSKGFQVFGGERFYPMPGPVPVLLPKSSEKLRRPWSQPLRRRLGWY